VLWDPAPRPKNSPELFVLKRFGYCGSFTTPVPDLKISQHWQAHFHLVLRKRFILNAGSTFKLKYQLV
jgi:hypothetical protein